jgi:hypothetical protein
VRGFTSDSARAKMVGPLRFCRAAVVVAITIAADSQLDSTCNINLSMIKENLKLGSSRFFLIFERKFEVKAWS